MLKTRHNDDATQIKKIAANKHKKMLIQNTSKRLTTLVCIRMVTLQKQWAIIRLYIIKAAFIATSARVMCVSIRPTLEFFLSAPYCLGIFIVTFSAYNGSLWIHVDLCLTSFKIKINVQKNAESFINCASCFPSCLDVNVLCVLN